MKKVIIILILINSIFSFGQNENLNQIYVDWENPKNFEKFNVKKVTVYSKDVKKNGKIKKDSLLLKQYEYNKEKFKIKGTNHNWLIIGHGGGSHREYYNFENEYSKDNLITRKSLFHLSEEKKEKEKIEHNSTIEEFEYDSFNNVIKNIVYNKNESIYLFKNDTTHLFISINNPKITEFEYDSKNRKIKQFQSTDSTTYYSKFDMKSEFKVSKSCTYCEEKYLAQEWKYDENKLLEWTTYTYKKEKHTKRNYFYDENKNLVKQIDSTGWYFTNKRPYLDSNTEIVYNQYGKFITTIDNKNKTFPKYYYKTIQYFDKNNFLIRDKKYSENQIDIKEYFYENTILKYDTSKYGKSETIKFEYLYNEKGLLKEIKHLIGNKLVNIERYYYE
ncbi:hypothetical protein M9Q43_01380 [Flavobacterium sp. HXWNR29]|uniref:hypothetical protein n=1 Tax=Flavobacterium odoriferum TaxID=2946604 RepID=UPI0021CB7760|nr:hypothetical protein [Flavobacterium sp. HXWNR29]MCU4187810.1 hypothetical protein [Flavobacterium sp. HXWNR29]